MFDEVAYRKILVLNQKRSTRINTSQYNLLLISRKTIGAYPILRFKAMIKREDTSH